MTDEHAWWARNCGRSSRGAPGSARRLAGLPAGELANVDVAATEVFGRFAAELREQVSVQRSWDGRFAVLGSLLERRARERGADGREEIRPEVARAAGGATVVQELTDKPYGSRDFAVLDPTSHHFSSLHHFWPFWRPVCPSSKDQK